MHEKWRIIINILSKVLLIFINIRSLDMSNKWASSQLMIVFFFKKQISDYLLIDLTF